MTNRTAQVDGLSVFYREAGDPANPRLLLLGGFPASSHQFRNLIPALADRFHVLSPDYPGFGNTEMPDDFEYTFDRLSEIVEGLLEQVAFHSFGLYHQDYGGPIGNRIVGRHPDWLEWQVIQNSNAYEEDFTAAWDGIRHALWVDRSPETEAPLLPFLELDGVKLVYTHGHRDPRLISPDNWNMDLHFLERPGAREVQLDLLYDYRTNVELYPQWQSFLREHRPKTLILWGENDIFFTPEGGRRPSLDSRITALCSSGLHARPMLHADARASSLIPMGALLAKIADIAWQIFKGGREVRARVHSAAAGALLHLRGVRNAPHGDSSEYRNEKSLLGEKLTELTLAAGQSPGKFTEELRIALLIQDAVVIRGERYVDEYIVQLERIVPSDS